MPIGEWIKTSLSDWALDTLKTLDPSRYNIPSVIKMYNDHKSGKKNYTRPLRTLLMTATWMKQAF